MRTTLDVVMTNIHAALLYIMMHDTFPYLSQKLITHGFSYSLLVAGCSYIHHF
jgi:hypothetical protein